MPLRSYQRNKNNLQLYRCLCMYGSQNGFRILCSLLDHAQLYLDYFRTQPLKLFQEEEKEEEEDNDEPVWKKQKI